MKKLIYFIKEILPQPIKHFIQRRYNKPIYNYFKSQNSKKALLSYIVYPFKINSTAHTNYFEVQTWANILDELGYQVDIIHYEYCPVNINVLEYDLICGFGDVFDIYMNTPKAKAKTIIYATGMHVCTQNTNTMIRLKELYKKKNIWLGDSTRFNSKSWNFHTSFTDVTISLGNEYAADSYRKYTENVYSLDAPFFKVLDFEDILDDKKEDFQKHFLWFGSSGAIHKGLDLLLDYFSKNQNVVLHIAGSIEKERDFVDLYKEELYNTKNIYFYGFIDIESKTYENLLKQCGYIIYPSCSEGGSPSVLTCIGNGGLFPIITKETTIDIPNKVYIDKFDEESISNSIKSVQEIEKDDLLVQMQQNVLEVNNKNNLKKYERNLKNIIKGII